MCVCVCVLSLFSHRFGDSRGYFNELYNETKYDVKPGDGNGGQGEWKQVSFSSSGKHALRGLHCSQYGKFITCVRGAFYDVIADFRDGSPTFGRWCGILLTEHNKKQVYVPKGCGHGFFTFEDNTCCLLYTSPSPRDRQKSRMPSSA